MKWMVLKWKLLHIVEICSMHQKIRWLHFVLPITTRRMGSSLMFNLRKTVFQLSFTMIRLMGLQTVVVTYGFLLLRNYSNLMLVVGFINVLVEREYPLYLTC